MDPAVLERLQGVPLPEYSVAALKIVDKGGEVVPLDFTGRPGQLKLAAAIESQKAQGLPVRVVLVKSRQFGGSTAVQAEMTKRATTTARRRILTVAHRLDTAESLFAMADLMYSNLPDGMRPPLGHFTNPARGTKILHLGEKVGGRIVGWPNSRMSIDTAEELGGGRGLTFTDIHMTEVAYWRDRRKALSLLPAVANREGTSIFLESTANGLNWFYDFTQRAEKGLSEFVVVFVGWHEDPDCVRRFATPEAREEFVADIGNVNGVAGTIAEDEPWLVETFGCTPEQLYFRRTAIVDRCDGKIELFRQEFPATLQEAFVGSGRQVFSVIFTQRMAKEVEHWAKVPAEAGGPQQGILMGVEPVTRQLTDGEVEVPTKVLWVPEAEIPARAEWWPGQFHEPKDPLWTVWLPPDRSAEEWRQAHEAGTVDLEEMEAGMAAALRPRQCIVAGDAAGDTFNGVAAQIDEHAFNTLVGIDHWTGVQVAEWRGRVDHDLVARQAYLIGLFLNEALLSIERTGGYGNVMLDLLQRRYYYRRLYTEKVLDAKKQQEVNRLGWDTNRRTKPQMEGTAQALLREGSHGIRSPLLAAEFQSYVKDEKNPARHEPAAGAFSDLLMAWMQAQELRRMVRPRPAPPRDGHRPNSMTRRIRR
jgi:hypothetical protein